MNDNIEINDAMNKNAIFENTYHGLFDWIIGISQRIEKK
jgi:hypothetical protein